MRRLALAACAAAAVSSFAPTASAGTVSEACWTVVPTFRLSGTVCRNAPTDMVEWCFDNVPAFRLEGLVCTKVPPGTR